MMSGMRQGSVVRCCCVVEAIDTEEGARLKVHGVLATSEGYLQFIRMSSSVTDGV